MSTITTIDYKAWDKGPVVKGVYYPGSPYGITPTHRDQINAELLSFFKGTR